MASSCRRGHLITRTAGCIASPINSSRLQSIEPPEQNIYTQYMCGIPVTRRYIGKQLFKSYDTKVPRVYV